jgi:cell division protein FtsL
MARTAAMKLATEGKARRSRNHKEKTILTTKVAKITKFKKVL